ncbi:hypothetical protein RCH05_004052 [Janthinobacterium sp. CAN_S7]
MILINQMACSIEFNAALKSLDGGHAVRRASWPVGMVLRKQETQIRVIREGSQIAPPWMGPSGAETEANDWQTV